MISIFICEPCLLLIHLFLEQAEGYVKALEKSTFQVLSWREVFEHYGQND